MVDSFFFFILVFYLLFPTENLGVFYYDLGWAFLFLSFFSFFLKANRYRLSITKQKNENFHFFVFVEINNPFIHIELIELKRIEWL
jgi:hypothetical protein